MAKSLKLSCSTAWNSPSLLVQISNSSELSREVLDPSWSPAISYLGSVWFSSLRSIIPASQSHSVCNPFLLLSERLPRHLSPSLAHCPPPTFMGEEATHSLPFFRPLTAMAQVSITKKPSVPAPSLILFSPSDFLHPEEVVALAVPEDEEGGKDVLITLSSPVFSCTWVSYSLLWSSSLAASHIIRRPRAPRSWNLLRTWCLR